MKIIVPFLMTFILISCVHVKSKGPKIHVVIEGKTYDIGTNTMAKIDISWIKSINAMKDERATYIYVKDEFKDKCLGAIGLKEDTNVYQTVDIYPEFKYSGQKETEASLKVYFIENFKLPSELKGKSYENNIYVYAIIEKNGKLSEIRVNKGGDEIINKSIIDFLQNMPAWQPARIGKSNVRYKYLFAVHGSWLK